MERQAEEPLAVVSVPRKRARTKPDREVRARWAWTERRVWADRLLTALVHGVEGGDRYGNAFFRAAGFFSLEVAWRQDRQSSTR